MKKYITGWANVTGKVPIHKKNRLLQVRKYLNFKGIWVIYRVIVWPAAGFMTGGFS